MKRSRLIPILSMVALVISALACGSSPGTQETADTAVPTAGVQVREATFAHGLADDGGPVDPGTEFTPDETVYLSLIVKGRPKEGMVSAQFFLGEELVAEADIDLSEVNEGVIFSIGEDTYVNFWLSSDDALPISRAWRADVSYDDEFIDSYTFSVVPPPDAVPSVVREATLARGVDDDYNPIDPADTFRPDEKVYLVARGDIGQYTWLEVEWYVDGDLDASGTNSITAQENKTDAGFFFSYLPDGGWPEGEHYVVLTMDDEEVGRYDFTIKEMALVPFEDPEGVFTISYPPNFDQIEKSTEGGYSYTFDAPGGWSILYIFFGYLGQSLTDEQWQAFADGYSVAGIAGFGEDTVEVERQLGEPGAHVLFLEVESEETNVHGLVWVEEADGVLAVVVLVVPIDEWPTREAEIRASLESFTWSPETAYTVLGE
jgi:hypothetical protein